MIHVVRKTDKGWDTNSIGLADPHEALETVREQHELPGSNDRLYAFEIKEKEDGTPIFDFCGALEPS